MWVFNAPWYDSYAYLLMFFIKSPQQIVDLFFNNKQSSFPFRGIQAQDVSHTQVSRIDDQMWAVEFFSVCYIFICMLCICIYIAHISVAPNSQKIKFNFPMYKCRLCLQLIKINALT